MAGPYEKYQKIEIIERKDFSPELWTIRARAEEKLSFKPGQYATLAVEHDGRMIQRAYSIVSSPLEDEIEFFFELVPEGELTPLLFKGQPGDCFWMRRQSRGLFILDEKTGHKRHFLVCTVTGVAPYVSIVRTLARHEAGGAPVEHELFLLQAASRSWEFTYCDELRDFERRCRWFRYVPTVSRPWEDPGWSGEVGRADDVVRKHLDSFGLDPLTTTAYLCGHPQMIENCKGILKRRGFAKESIREEIYWIPAKPAPART